jgi:hypothetical protein
VKLLSSFASSCIGFFGRFKDAKVMPLAVNFDAGNVELTGLSGYKRDSFVSCGVVFLLASISMVFGRRGSSQIAPTIVRTVFVDVVDFVSWPLARHQQPNDAVGHVFTTVYSYFHAISITIARNLSGLCLSAKWIFPPQNAGFWIVIKSVLYAELRKVLLSVFVSSHARFLPVGG